jgi:hypothetical protein
MSLVAEGSRISTTGVHPLTPSTEVTLVESTYRVCTCFDVGARRPQTNDVKLVKAIRIRDFQLNEHVTSTNHTCFGHKFSPLLPASFPFPFHRLD